MHLFSAYASPFWKNRIGGCICSLLMHPRFENNGFGDASVLCLCIPELKKQDLGMHPVLSMHPNYRKSTFWDEKSTASSSQITENQPLGMKNLPQYHPKSRKNTPLGWTALLIIIPNHWKSTIRDEKSSSISSQIAKNDPCGMKSHPNFHPKQRKKLTLGMHFSD